MLGDPDAPPCDCLACAAATEIPSDPAGRAAWKRALAERVRREQRAWGRGAEMTVIEGEARTVASEQRPAESATREIPLPNTRASRAWREGTERLLADLERDEAAALADYQDFKARAEAELRVKRARVEQARKAVAAIRQVLGVVVVDGAKALPAPTSKPAAPPTNGKAVRPSPAGAWAAQHERCVDCGTTERKHAAGGRCTQCYWRAYTARRAQARPDEDAAEPPRGRDEG